MLDSAREVFLTRGKPVRHVGTPGEDDDDRRQWLRTLIEKHEVHDVQIAAGTLMRNHFHLVVITPNGNLSEFMARLQGEYARYFNRRHGYVGHVFQGRFRHVQIENDAHMLTALCYLFMNPVTAGIVEKLEDYKWSSYAAAAGYRPVPGYLSLDWLQALYPTLTLSDAQQRLRKLMSEPKPVAHYLNSFELNVDGETIGEVAALLERSSGGVPICSHQSTCRPSRPVG